MITPLVSSAQFAHIYPSIQPGAGKPTIVYYKHQGVDYHSAVKLWVGIDDSRAIICPACGCPVRQLTHYEDRPGLCCVDCVTKRRRKDDTLPTQVKAKSPAKRKPFTLSKRRKARAA